MKGRSPAERDACLDALQHDAQHLDLDRDGVLMAALGAIQEAFDVDWVCAYRLEEKPFAVGYEVDFFHEKARRRVRPFRGALERHVASLRGDLGAYHPTRPQRAQRNRTLRHGAAELESAFGPLLREHALQGMSQMRVLLCEGPQLLSWFGGWRSEPFTPSEQRALDRIVPTLRRRLSLEHRLGEARLLRAQLDVALDALATSALLVDLRGRVRYANALARETSVADARAVDDAVSRAAKGEATPGFDVTKVREGGVHRGYLVVASAQVAAASDLARRARHAYRLTAREAGVVERLLKGESRKIIAAHLGCSLRTIEAHCTAIYRKANVATGAELVAKLAAT